MRKLIDEDELAVTPAVFLGHMYLVSSLRLANGENVSELVEQIEEELRRRTDKARAVTYEFIQKEWARCVGGKDEMLMNGIIKRYHKICYSRKYDLVPQNSDGRRTD